jgi:hypothetical protein
MKKVKFVKDHPVGIKEGAIHTVRSVAADRWIAQGYAVEFEPSPEQPPVELESLGDPEPKVSKPKKGEKKK